MAIKIVIKQNWGKENFMPSRKKSLENHDVKKTVISDEIRNFKYGPALYQSLCNRKLLNGFSDIKEIIYYKFVQNRESIKHFI